MLNKEIINYQNKQYWIYRKIRQYNVKEEFIQELKDFWCCDVVVKYRNNQDDNILFLREITDLEILN